MDWKDAPIEMDGVRMRVLQNSSQRLVDGSFVQRQRHPFLMVTRICAYLHTEHVEIVPSPGVGPEQTAGSQQEGAHRRPARGDAVSRPT